MASSEHRLIDQVATVSPRPQPMQVIALGMSRTGTYSMYTALNMLGYKTYHCAEIRLRAAGTYDLWIEALRAKFHGKGKRYGKVEFDKLLGDYSAITDIPCLMFTEELIQAYPDAKFLITTRDEDSWVKSITGLFNTILGWNWYVASFDRLRVQSYVEMITIVWNLWTGGNWKDEQKLRQSFRDHYALVRSKVPKDRLLEFHPSDGWEPLCKHLGIRDVPAEPYPRVNDLAFTIAIFDILWWATAKKAATDVALKVLIPGVAVGVGMLVYRL